MLKADLDKNKEQLVFTHKKGKKKAKGSDTEESPKKDS